MAKKQFKSESKRLLDLMIGSIYTHREIFLRELISNASDALDKLRYISLTDDKVGLTADDFRIEITADKDARTLTITDNGVGMTAEDLENNLGVIARSGSLKFKQEHADAPDDVDIIGQFGVGFYSAFMVAKRVTVLSRAYGADAANLWESAGSDGYTIAPAERETVGTDVVLYLRDDTEDDNFSEYLEEYTIHDLVKKYSDYITHPIVTAVTKSRRVEETHKHDDHEHTETKWEDYTETEVINSRVPVWQRAKSEVTDEQLNEFFRDQFGAEEDAAAIIRVAAEGAAVSYKALLFVPSTAPYDYFTREYEPGLRLYSSGVLIMEKCASLLPEHFRFVRGVVDSADLSLNISRETLQHDRQLKTIAANLEKKIRTELERLLSADRDGYAGFFRAFGIQLKYGLLADYGVNKDNLKDLLLFYSAKSEKLITAAEYVAAMPEEQKYIYYACGASLAALEKLPQAELLRKRGFDVLYLTDEIDEFVARQIGLYDEKEFRSVTSDDLGLLSDEETRDAEVAEEANKPLLDFIVESLGGKIAAAKISKKLVSAAVCLTTQGGVTLEMERYFAATRQVTDVMGEVKAERVLELNDGHEVFNKLKAAFEADKARAALFAELLYGQAVLMAGLPLDDAVRYAEITNELVGA
ncbi:MAG: molecular chaperone HtpG [Oscillospiraceae bacterium]|jgi:molecular chaperone HtpG|nr:molecular chaperone HtpG [Oscillospiraceae bacterium]